MLMPLARDDSECSECMEVRVVVAGLPQSLSEWKACVEDSWPEEVRNDVKES